MSKSESCSAPCLHQLQNGHTGQGRDPPHPRLRLQPIDLRRREHPAVADQHEVHQAEPRSEGLHLVGDRRRVARVPGIHTDRNGAPAAIGHHTVHDNRQTLLAVAVMPKARQGTGATLVITTRHVVEHHRAVGQMPIRQLPLDLILASQQPVHRVVQIVFVRPLHRQFFGQRRRLPDARRRQLRTRMQ